MEIQRFNRLRAAIKRVQSGACFDSDELSKWREPSMLAWELPSRVRGWRSQRDWRRNVTIRI